jgi:radical SAM superfamily enzyme YgiQ (UPF0313 family)
MTYEAGIKNKVFLVHGYPPEDMESVNETMQFLDEVGQWVERVSLFRFVPLPGTYVYNNPDQFGLRGTDKCADWDGDWGKYHIHHNHHHWWGTDEQFEELTASYWRLREYVESRWPSRFTLDEMPDDKWQTQRDALERTLEYHSGAYQTVNLPSLSTVNVGNIRQ